MVNSVQRLQEIKAFVRMASGKDLLRLGWNDDGTATNSDVAKLLRQTPGIVWIAISMGTIAVAKPGHRDDSGTR